MSRLIKRVPAEFAGQGYDGEWSDVEGMAFKGNPGNEPPEGDCYQVWQDVSAMTPISPVFSDPDACAAWLIRTHDCSAAAAKAFVEDGWAPSMIGGPFGVFTGVQVAAGEAAHIEYLWKQAGEECLPSGTRIRHKESGVLGRVNHRFPPGRSAEYYFVTWDWALPSLVAEDPSVDPDKPMDAGCRYDGFDVVDDGQSQ
jgi:hypothetical protein